MTIKLIHQNNNLMPILPQNIEDFQDKSIIEMRNYLLSDPVVQLFTVGEVRSLRDLSYLEDNVARGIVQACFKKLAKTPLPKWQKLIAEK
jgi:hypothetical protein